MGKRESLSFRLSKEKYDIQLKTDVLVLGGGPAGAWAAIRAAATGAKVVLVDKGYCGTSGATAPSGNGVWYISPEPEKREEAMQAREALGGYLADRAWMKRVLDQTYENVNRLEQWGYPFPLDVEGKIYKRSLQGPEYLRLLREQVLKAGVQILDHSPALELLVDGHGVAGAAGVRLQRDETWAIQANATVIATGGCAFLSKALGCNVLTGDGYLFAGEVGAQLSGMEFSNAYAITPVFASNTKTLFYNWATFTYEDGSVIEGAGSQKGRSVIARVISQGQKVFAQLDKATEEMQKSMRLAQPNFFLTFDRAGINPFTQRFEVTLILEGTVRGTGGIRIVDETCATSIPGLYAAGDAATRELICGGFTGGGSYNAGWAISSGWWSGEAAAKYALKINQEGKTRRAFGTGTAGLRPTHSLVHSLSSGDVIRDVQSQVNPYEINLFRTEEKLSSSLHQLNQLWTDVRGHLIERNGDVQKTREAAAMLATARWMYASALERKETRGMHKRLDHPQQDPNQHYRLLTGGLDEIWVRPESLVANQ